MLTTKLGENAIVSTRGLAPLNQLPGWRSFLVKIFSQGFNKHAASYHKDIRPLSQMQFTEQKNYFIDFQII